MSLERLAGPDHRSHLIGESELLLLRLATNSGWGEFGAWADALDATTFREVVCLWEHGYTRHVGVLVTQLDLALTRQPPTDPTVRDTAENLLKIAREAAAKGADDLSVTDGMGPSEDDEEDEWDEEAADFDPPESKAESVREGHGALPTPKKDKKPTPKQATKPAPKKGKKPAPKKPKKS